VTDAEKIAALVEYRLEQAREALPAADVNLANHPCARRSCSSPRHCPVTTMTLLCRMAHT
jgi:hypothetical protein